MGYCFFRIRTKIPFSFLYLPGLYFSCSTEYCLCKNVIRKHLYCRCRILFLYLQDGSVGILHYGTSVSVCFLWLLFSKMSISDNKKIFKCYTLFIQNYFQNSKHIVHKCLTSIFSVSIIQCILLSFYSSQEYFLNKVAQC